MARVEQLGDYGTPDSDWDIDWAVYLGRNGYDHERKVADSILTVGKAYEVELVAVSDFHTVYYLKEFPGKGFNSVMFRKEEKNETGVVHYRVLGDGKVTVGFTIDGDSPYSAAVIASICLASSTCVMSPYYLSGFSKEAEKSSEINAQLYKLGVGVEVPC